MTTHAMIDLETLDTKPSCQILSLGAVKFNALSDQEPHSELYIKPDIDQQDKLGRTTSDSTIDFKHCRDGQYFNFFVKIDQFQIIFHMINISLKRCSNCQRVSWSHGILLLICQ